MMRQSWIDKGDTVALTWQCALAGVSRAAVYARQKPKLITEDDEMLKRLIDEEYTRHPFYGSRKTEWPYGEINGNVLSQVPSRWLKVAPLNAPAMMPIRVIPI